MALGLNFVRNPVSIRARLTSASLQISSKAPSAARANHRVEQVVARQSILSLKAALRKMTLDEDKIEEVMARAGLQPEEPQYGVRTKGELDERTAER